MRLRDLGSAAIRNDAQDLWEKAGSSRICERMVTQFSHKNEDYEIMLPFENILGELCSCDA